MPTQATVTAPTGAGSSVSALVLTGVTEILILPAPKAVITIKHDKGISEYAINATTTFTVTASGGNLTIVISQ